MTPAQVKTQIDFDITNKTLVDSIDPIIVGKNMKDIVDLIPDSIVGPPGPQGVNGLKGDKGLIWKGVWSNTNSYQIDEAVEHEGSSYIAIAANVGFSPEQYSTLWNLIAKKGLDAVLSAKISQQVNVSNSNPEINQIDFVRIFANDVGQECNLTGPHVLGKEIYIKNETNFDVTLKGYVENINGQNTITLPSKSFWHLIKEDNGTNSITAYSLSTTTSRSYRTYLAVLNKTDVGLSIANVLINEIGNINLVQTSTNAYNLISSNAYTLNKTVIFSNFSDANNSTAKVIHTGLLDTISILFSPSGIGQSSAYSMSLEIRVYN